MKRGPSFNGNFPSGEVSPSINFEGPRVDYTGMLFPWPLKPEDAVVSPSLARGLVFFDAWKPQLCQGRVLFASDVFAVAPRSYFVGFPYHATNSTSKACVRARAILKRYNRGDSTM